MISASTTENVIKALERFDQDYRSNPEWIDWENKQNHKYAIRYQKRLYPVKQIISLATGDPVNVFSGGSEANNYLKARGFEIVDLPRDGDEDMLEEKATRNWSKPAGKPNLIGRKKVDKSMFTDGTSIPMQFIEGFLRAGGESTLEQGESRDLVLLLDGAEYKANLRSLNLAKSSRSIIQIRWDGNKELKAALKDRFTTTYQYVMERNEQKKIASYGIKEDSVDAPAEYLDFYETGTPYTYRLEAITDVSGQVHKPEHETEIKPPFIMDDKVAQLVQAILSQGYTFAPWQIAAYVCALKTKPFVILAGVSGTGKSKLPSLVAEATGSEKMLIPVRPDWTDSSEVLGYCNLQGIFLPGPLLSFASDAKEDRQKQFICIMDEMNLARVEHYFAEVLSRIEDRYPSKNGGFASHSLINQKLREEDKAWAEQGLPANFAIVGTVNMDESAHGFSRKVLDRAFTIEFAEIHLDSWKTSLTENSTINADSWPIEAWYPRALRLGDLTSISDAERQAITQVIDALTSINQILIKAQLQVGYRIRDELALFVLHAREMASSFIDHQGNKVDPLDMAIQMKVLPRIIGGSSAIRQVVLEMLAWSTGKKITTEPDAQSLLDSWINEGRPSTLKDAKFSRTAARLCLMWDRLINEGFTSFWM